VIAHFSIALFWVALVLIAYAYVGYPVWLKVVATLRPRPVRRAPITPSLSIVIAVHNEERSLPAKIVNLQQLEYPRPFQAVLVSDGSTDRTNELLSAAPDFVHAILLREARGKAAALNAAVGAATGDLLVFFDARQTVGENALLELASFFADETVGAVSGELVLDDASGAPKVGIYWRIEKLIRRLESDSGSVAGVTGAIYAMRRELYQPLPEGTILDDLLTPMNVVRAGKRVVFCSTAVARDQVFSESRKEFSRKVRTLTGNYQLFKLAPWLLTARNPILFRFLSHKVLRLAVPLLLVLLVISAACAAGSFYKLALVAQLIFYGLAALGWLSPPARRFRLVAIAETFTMLNVAAAFALYNFATGRRKVWV
jgi:cellulose synthase/poly-beta-1,6-N-acetylglucosamine synthase-like glycosyltransferase